MDQVLPLDIEEYPITRKLSAAVSPQAVLIVWCFTPLCGLDFNDRPVMCQELIPILV